MSDEVYVLSCATSHGYDYSVVAAFRSFEQATRWEPGDWEETDLGQWQMGDHRIDRVGL